MNLIGREDPHLQIPIIHVGGTNGKGSICAYLDQILRQAGYRVGRFTSPYLLKLSDSISLNGQEVNLIEFEKVKLKIETLSKNQKINASGFEILTAVAFDLFAHRPSSELPLDLAIIEVGLGGQDDATNVGDSSNTLISVVSAISLDHQSFLGNTLEEIAKVKAGIAKRDVPLVLADQSVEDPNHSIHQVFKLHTQTTQSDLFLADRIQTSLSVPFEGKLEGERIKIPTKPAESFLHTSAQLPLWDWQSNSGSILLEPLSRPLAHYEYHNIHTTVLLCSLLRSHPHPLKLLPSLRENLTDHAIQTGLASTRWRGRLEWSLLPPLYPSGPQVSLLLDGAHNPAGAKALSQVISLQSRPITLIIGFSSPRDPVEMMGSIFSQLNLQIHQPKLFVTRFEPLEIETGMSWVKPVEPNVMIKAINQLSLPIQDGLVFDELGNALVKARAEAREDELVVVCGSLYLIADTIRWMEKSLG
ncbi:Mur ligase [Melampsora americana]|nr:Mur ligase [Melampsora americana]